MSIPSPLHALKMPPDLACEFFAVFSRFEFALQEAGYVYIHRGRAAPDWHGFADVAVLQVPAGSDLAQAVDLLNQEPPQVQVSAHRWEPMPLRGATPVATAIDAAQRVRHNLFHGGKHTPHSPAGRDEALVRAAMVVQIGRAHV